MNNIKDFLNSDAANLDMGLIFFVLFISLIAVSLLVLLIIFCVKTERYSGTKSFSAIKIIAIALIPTIYGIANLSGNENSFPFILIWDMPVWGILTVIICVAVLIWNIISYGLFRGIAFSIVHIVVGMIMSLGVVALIFGAAVMVLLTIFSASTYVGETQRIPDGVYDLDTGINYDITIGVNGSVYLNSGGRSGVLYLSGDRYYDSYGNQYKAFYD